ncbi:hypothetical protein [Streptomyces sp. NPDC003401]
MTPAAAGLVPCLPWHDAPLDLIPVGGTWSAVSMPTAWGRLVWDVLAERSGPVLEDCVTARMLWPIRPGDADGWPDGSLVGLTVHRPGDLVTVCGTLGYRNVMRWLRVPAARHWATEGALSRAAVEFVVGPLAEVAPVQVRAYCRATTRHGRLLERVYQQSGPGAELWVCSPCWTSALRGGPGRHLRAVREGPL